MNFNKKSRRRLFFVGVGVLTFTVMLAASELTLVFLDSFSARSDFNQYTVPLIVMPLFALVFTVAVIVAAYSVMKRTNILIVNLTRVAEGDFSAEIDYKKRDMFANVYANFNKMTRELNSAKAVRDEFMQGLAHEIKTPLFSIQGFANLLYDGGLSEEEQKKFLTIISGEAGRLINLAENQLTLAKLESQQLADSREKLRLDSEINDCVIMLEKEWEKKNIDIYCDLQPVYAVGSRTMLRQVWLNLLSNAVKFTPEGGRIEVTLKREGAHALAIFKDSGAGISPEDMPRIFEKYYRAKSAAGTQGNGLGLAICKRICDISGGEITAANAADGGAAFTVKLPAADKED